MSPSLNFPFDVDFASSRSRRERTQGTPSLVRAICGAASYGLAPARLIPDSRSELGVLLARRPLLPSKLFRSLSRRRHARPSPALQLDADADMLAPAPHSSRTDLPDAEGRTAATRAEAAGFWQFYSAALERACGTQFELLVRPRLDCASNEICRRR
ncbi:hypothetical protein B0H13DRAFT_2357616 [Mycena leptocephala]|nr:hypothetical protein B0H13DRAFT_2357616 [Mycena leptocephala]